MCCVMELQNFLLLKQLNGNCKQRRNTEHNYNITHIYENKKEWTQATCMYFTFANYVDCTVYYRCTIHIAQRQKKTMF